MSQSEDIEIKKKNRVKTLGIVVGVLTILLLTLYIALQWSPIQNWVANMITERLSRDFGTTIEIDRVDIDFTNHILLKGIYVEDKNGDTLVYAQVFKTNLARSIFSFLTKQAYINDLILENGTVNIITRLGDRSSGFDEIFGVSPEEASDTSTTDWNIKISKAYLSDISVNVLNENEGKKDVFAISKGTLIINPNSSKGVLEVKNIDLESPSILSERWQVDQIAEAITDGIKTEEGKDETSQKNRSIIIRNINIRNGTWSLTDSNKPTTLLDQGFFDPNHIGLEEVNIIVEDLVWKDEKYTIGPVELKAITNSGFEIDHLSANLLSIDNRKIKINNFSIKTRESVINSEIDFSFKELEDFNQFADKVFIKMDVNRSKVSLNEIVHFVPKLKNNEFIQQNHNLIASVDGEVSGKINNLRIKNLALSAGNNLKIIGDYHARDLTDPRETLLNLNLREFRSDINTLKKIIPGFDPPAQFTRVGQFNFEGQFDGYYEDFVAFGTLNSELGSADMDMRLDLERGRDLAEYSGSIDLQNFNLGLWTSNSDLGFINGIAEVTNGRGLTASTAKAVLQANVSSVEFKKYQYKDVNFNGSLEQGQFDGSLIILDENIDIDFVGQIVYGSEQPLYNFEATVNYINLFKLNLVKRPFLASGLINMDATNLNINTLDGDINLSNIQLNIDDSLSYTFDELQLHSEFESEQKKKLSITSELVDLSIEGAYEIEKIPHAFMKILASNYSAFYHKLKLPDKYLAYQGDQNYNFDVHVKNSANLLKLINSPIDTIIELHANGSIDESANYFSVSLNTPILNIESNTLYGVELMVENNNTDLYSKIVLDSGFYAYQLKTQAIQLDNHLTQDTFSFNIITKGVSDVLQSLIVGGDLFLENDHYGIVFNSKNLTLLDDKWNINEKNKLLFGDDFIRLSDMNLSNGEQFIYFNSINDKGIEIGSEFFDVKFVNEVWVYDKLNFNGPFDLYLRTDDVFTMSNFETHLHLDSFWINGDHYGELLFDATSTGIKQAINVNLRIEDSTKLLTADGAIIPKGFGIPASDITYLDLEFQLDKYPAKIIEYWIGEGVENTTGLVDVYLDMDGTTDDLRMYGVGKMRGVGTKIIYLGTTYQIEDTDIPITSNFIDLDGGTLIDKYGNRGSAVGGILHENLRNLTLDVTLSSDHFLALNTDKYHGESYYGHAIGQLNVNFTGDIDAPDIKINGHPTIGTVLQIPLEKASAISENDFIVFYSDTIFSKEDENREEIFKIKGVHVDMDLIVDENSEVRIILDELEENIVVGYGNGNMNVILTRAGDFELFGNYTIDRGKYFYSYLIFEREFDVVQGGTLTWTGDPYNAQIDIRAEHNINTSLYAFIYENLLDASQQTIDEAQKNQRVKVIMIMDGPLFSPNINFDLEFPNLSTGQVASWANIKKNSLQDNQGELNRQVIGLLSSGTFLSDQGPNNAGDFIATATINSFSSYFSNQLSDVLSEILRDPLTDISFIDNFYFNVNYKQNDLIEGGNDNVFTFSPRLELFGGKVDVDFQNYYVRSRGLNENYYAEDLTVDWYLSNNRRLKLQAYQEYDFELGNRKLEFGIGLNYSRDFDRIFGRRNSKTSSPQ